MIKTFIFSLLIIAAIILLCYFFQPLKKGKGLDTTTSYELAENWLHLPNDFRLGNPTGISMDTSQNLVVFHRAGREWPLIGSMPGKLIESKTILIIDRINGQLLNSWGENLFIMPHGLKVDRQNNIWVTDVGLQQVFKFTHEGKLLLKVGEARVAGNDSLHFDKPTDIAIAPGGSFYVSDGYGNNRIVKFSSAGKYLGEWGGKGKKEGEFNLPHGITLDEKGNVYVADRENNRIEEFDSTGKYITQYSDDSFGSICAVTFDPSYSKLYAVDDLTFLRVKHRGSDVIVIDTTGRVQTRFGRSGSYEGKISWYHDVAIDKDRNIYVGDILGNTIQKFRRVSNAATRSKTD